MRAAHRVKGVPPGASGEVHVAPPRALLHDRRHDQVGPCAPATVKAQLGWRPRDKRPKGRARRPRRNRVVLCAVAMCFQRNFDASWSLCEECGGLSCTRPEGLVGVQRGAGAGACHAHVQKAVQVSSVERVRPRCPVTAARVPCGTTAHPARTGRRSGRSARRPGPATTSAARWAPACALPRPPARCSRPTICARRGGPTDSGLMVQAQGFGMHAASSASACSRPTICARAGVFT